MKINGLRLKNFRCHRDTVLALDQLNVIIGRNGAGKTSIKDAIEYGLTGISRLTDGRGAGAEVMINWGADRAEIIINLEDIGSITREIPNALQVADWEGNKTAQEETLLSKLGVDKRTIRAILNTTNFIRLDPEEQKELLFDLAGMRFDKEKIIRAFLKWNQGEIDTSANILEEIIPDDIRGGSELFNLIYQDIYQLRREEKKRLKGIENRLERTSKPPPLPDNIQPEDRARIQNQYEGLSRERDQLLKNLGKIETELGRRDELKDRVANLENNIGEIEQALEGNRCQSDELPGLEEEKKELVKQINTAEDTQKKLQSEYQQLRLLNREKREAVASLKEHESSCPLAPDYVNCPLTTEEVGRLVDKLEGEVETARELELEQSLKKLQKERDKLAKSLEETTARIEDFKEKLKAWEEREQTLGQLNKKLKESKRELEKLDRLEEPSEFQKRIEILNKRLEKGQEILKTIDRLEEWEALNEEYSAERKELVERVAALELLVKAFKPTGIQNNLLKSLKNRFEDQANQVLEKLTTGVYQVSLQTGGDELLLVKKEDWTDWASSRVLSTSEELRVGVIIQHVLNKLTGLDFMLIDEADTLEPANRQLLINTVLELREEYDQIIILSTVGERKPVNPGIPGLKVWWLDETVCQEI